MVGDLSKRGSRAKLVAAVLGAAALATPPSLAVAQQSAATYGPSEPPALDHCPHPTSPSATHYPERPQFCPCDYEHGGRHPAPSSTSGRRVAGIGRQRFQFRPFGVFITGSVKTRLSARTTGDVKQTIVPSPSHGSLYRARAFSPRISRCSSSES